MPRYERLSHKGRYVTDHPPFTYNYDLAPCNPRTMATWAKTSKLINKRRFTSISQSIPSGEGLDFENRR